MTGPVTAEHFAIERAPVPAAREGEFVVQNVFLSLDPYQRRQMMPGVRYVQPLRVGDVMVGRTIGRVVDSRHSGYAVGDWVRGSLGWQSFSVSDGKHAQRIDLDGFAPSLYLGILGSPGFTAWVGLRHVARIRAGETVVISAATGAVGSVAVRLAKSAGCRVVGFAGGMRNTAELLNRNVMLQGFRIAHYASCHGAAVAELKERLRKGEMVVHETLTDGLANAPSAFEALLAGAHLGKSLIRIGE